MISSFVYIKLILCKQKREFATAILLDCNMFWNTSDLAAKAGRTCFCLAFRGWGFRDSQYIERGEKNKYSYTGFSGKFRFFTIQTKQ